MKWVMIERFFKHLEETQISHTNLERVSSREREFILRDNIVLSVRSLSSSKQE